MDTIEQARQNIAARYPEALVDSMGREHPCIPRKAVLSGAWDNAPAMLEEVARLQGEDVGV